MQTQVKSFSEHFVKSSESLIVYHPDGWEHCSEEKRRLATWSEEQLLREIESLKIKVQEEQQKNSPNREWPHLEALYHKMLEERNLWKSRACIYTNDCFNCGLGFKSYRSDHTHCEDCI